MVTFRQTVRSINSAVKAAEREQKRHQKEVDRFHYQQLKLDEIADTTEAVSEYNDYMNDLILIHITCSKAVDWRGVLKTSEPPKPEIKSIHENKAQENLNNYKPSFLHKITGSKKEINRLCNELEKARNQDKKNYNIAKTNYKEWEITQSIANGVIAQEPDSYSKAIDHFSVFSNIKGLGSKVEVLFSDLSADICVYLNTPDIIPDYIVSQTSIGKLSKKNLPKSKFNEFYQSYVCGSILRVARETFAHLPLNKLSVHALVDMVNPVTGHLEETPIVSAIIPYQTLDRLNFNTLNPLASLSNFIFEMKFSKLKGFSRIEKVKIDVKLD